VLIGHGEEMLLFLSGTNPGLATLRELKEGLVSAVNSVSSLTAFCRSLCFIARCVHLPAITRPSQRKLARTVARLATVAVAEGCVRTHYLLRFLFVQLVTGFDDRTISGTRTSLRELILAFIALKAVTNVFRARGAVRA